MVLLLYKSYESIQLVAYLWSEMSTGSGGSAANRTSSGGGHHQRFSVHCPVPVISPDLSGNVGTSSSQVTGGVPKRKGASTVGLGLSDMNQQFCSTMMGITFGSSAACQVLI